MMPSPQITFIACGSVPFGLQLSHVNEVSMLMGWFMSTELGYRAWWKGDMLQHNI